MKGGPALKIATLLVRSLMGLLFLFASATWFLKLFTPPPLAGAMKSFSEGMEASVYLVPTVKTVELLCGLAFLSGRFVPLATVLIAPVIVNILLIHVFLDRTGLPVAVFLVLANGFLAYTNRDRYRPLLQP